MTNYIVKIYNYNDFMIYQETIQARNGKDALLQVLDKGIIIYDGDKITIDTED